MKSAVVRLIHPMPGWLAHPILRGVKTGSSYSSEEVDSVSQNIETILLTTNTASLARPTCKAQS